MENNQQARPGDLADDIMLSSAEDLNNDGSFMGAKPRDDFLPEPDEPKGQSAEDKELDEAVEEIMHEEAEPEKIQVVSAPEMHIPKSTPKPEPRIVTAETYRGVNKMALAWMIILTIILGGVVGIMLYALILQQTEGGEASVAEPENSQVEDLGVIAGALEVYLNEVDLNRYNGDIVLVNNGGMVTLTGSFDHTVYINSRSALTLVLKDVKINSPENSAIVGLSENDIVLKIEGQNTLNSDGGKYAAALYTAGPLTIKGNGALNVYSGGLGDRGIASAKGYQIHGGDITVLAQATVERPMKESTQGYFAKELPQAYSEGTTITAAADNEGEILKTTAPGKFSSMLVSNAMIENGVQYNINIGGGGEN